MMPRSIGRWRRGTWLLAAAAVVLLAFTVASVASDLDLFSRSGSDARTAAPEPTTIAYIPYWDQRRGFEVARENPALFDEVSPVWYSLEPTGEVVLTDTDHTSIDRATVRFLQEHGVRVIPTVTSLRDGQWQPELVIEMLHDPEAVARHVRQLVRLAVDKGYDGIDIDYEDLREQDREAFSAFLATLGGALRTEGKVLTVAVHAKDSVEGYDERNRAQDYRAIGRAADQVRVMTYDYSWSTSSPGPVAPVLWVEEVIAWTVTQIPPEKVILGVMLVGYDWLGEDGESVEHDVARETATTHGVEVERAEDLSPWFRYEDSSGNVREVWFEDAVSAAVKLELVSRYELGGAFFWRLGGEDPQVWQTVREQL